MLTNEDIDALKRILVEWGMVQELFKNTGRQEYRASLRLQSLFGDVTRDLDRRHTVDIRVVKVEPITSADGPLLATLFPERKTE